MRTILHILTHPEDDLAARIIAVQRQQPELRVEVADLTSGSPDYELLVQQLFAADTAQVW